MFDDQGLFIQLPTIIKARSEGERRMVEICASKQVVDDEGDLVLQAALLNAGPAFVRSGHLDLEHLSEIGERLGLDHPSDYVVGNPVEVKDFGGGSTGVLGELQRGRPHAEKIWEGLTASPPVRWQASIYGFPLSGGLFDARTCKSEDMQGATRFLVKAIDWRSLAFTMRPINTAVDAARVYTAKSFLAIMKSRGGIGNDIAKMESVTPQVNFLLPPRNREELMGHLVYHIRRGNCPCAGVDPVNSVANFRDHFMICCGEPDWDADIKALALMHLLKRERTGSIGFSI